MKNTKVKAWLKTALGSGCRPRADSSPGLARLSVPVSSLADYRWKIFPLILHCGGHHVRVLIPAVFGLSLTQTEKLCDLIKHQRRPRA